MPKPLQETGRITEAAVAAAKETGRLPVQLISPGKGSSGYYAAEVLEQAVADDLFPAGTHMYADHPTAQEAKDRPVRSIKDLMSVTAIPGRIATEEDVAGWGADLGAVVAEVDVLPQYRESIGILKDAIGVSIRGDGEINENGTDPDGNACRVVESLAHVQSVDWVTRAGRGGKVLSLVESARANERAIRHGISEATVNDTREALQTALRDAHATAKDTWLWVRDFDDTTVWFELEGSGAGDDAGIYGQTYTEDDGAVTLTGTRTEVRVVTKYVSVTRPDSTNPTTEESQEDTMGNKSIDEAEFTRLTETAGRVDALVTENATKDARIKELEEADAIRVRTSRATEIVEARAKEAGVGYTTLEVRGFCADLPLKEDGTLDEAAFTTTVDEDAAARKAAGGAGRVIGHGGVTEDGSDPITLADLDEALGLDDDKED